jgi:DNA-binding transcriptional MerR regulator
MEHVLTAGEAGKRCGLSRDDVYYYERLGVVKPLRDSANRRLYSEAGIQAIKTHRMRSGRA